VEPRQIVALAWGHTLLTGLAGELSTVRKIGMHAEPRRGDWPSIGRTHMLEDDAGHRVADVSVAVEPVMHADADIDRPSDPSVGALLPNELVPPKLRHLDLAGRRSESM
jgi:hypothetical protein